MEPSTNKDALLERIHPSVGVLVDGGSPAARRNAAGQSKRILASAPRWFVLSETGALGIDLEGGRIRVRPSKPRGLPPPKTASEDMPEDDVQPP